MPAPTKFERMGATAILMLVWLVNYIPVRVVHQFEQVYAGFGGVLPIPTQIVMDFPQLFLLVPVVCTVAYVLYWFNVRYMVRIQAVGAVLSLLATPAVIILMYLPIFQLGTGVGE